MVGGVTTASTRIETPVTLASMRVALLGLLVALAIVDCTEAAVAGVVWMLTPTTTLADRMVTSTADGSTLAWFANAFFISVFTFGVNEEMSPSSKRDNATMLIAGVEGGGGEGEGSGEGGGGEGKGGGGEGEGGGGEGEGGGGEGGGGEGEGGGGDGDGRKGGIKIGNGGGGGGGGNGDEGDGSGDGGGDEGGGSCDGAGGGGGGGEGGGDEGEGGGNEGKGRGGEGEGGGGEGEGGGGEGGGGMTGSKQMMKPPRTTEESVFQVSRVPTGAALMLAMALKAAVPDWVPEQNPPRAQLAQLVSGAPGAPGQMPGAYPEAVTSFMGGAELMAG